MKLFDAISAAAYKELVRVDLPERGSNQHEINGVQPLRDFFQTADKIRGSVTWHYFSEDESPLEEIGQFTFYNAREFQIKRSAEWRLYYDGAFLRIAREGDILVLVRTKEQLDAVHGLVFQKDSSWLRCAEQLFGVTSLNPTNFEVLSEQMLQTTEMDYLGLRILDALDVAEPGSTVISTDVDLVLQNFGGRFPTTKVMSEFARKQVGAIDLGDADRVLVRWLEREEQLFRALERLIVEQQLKSGFRDVDHFLEFSLSVQNRRKSRMGFALQNNLAQLFDLNKIQYDAQAATEGRNRPDFIFPGALEYHDPNFDVQLLVMLGAKSTLKDRWRQILTEANKIPLKHLCTLEPGISAHQTEEIRTHSVQLVIPAPFHKTYLPGQRKQIWTLASFISFVRAKQRIDS